MEKSNFVLEVHLFFIFYYNTCQYLIMIIVTFHIFLFTLSLSNKTQFSRQGDTHNENEIFFFYYSHTTCLTGNTYVYIPSFIQYVGV